MQRLLLIALTLLLTGPAAAQRSFAPLPADDATLTRIGFGSCANQTRPQPVWDTIGQLRPELFLFIGDNMYADLERNERAITIDDVHACYAALEAVPQFRSFWQQVPILATWDDHDYGLNDAGGELPFKAESQQAFLDFYGIPADSPRRAREGVYHAEVFGPEGRRVQVILLDTRYHRSELSSVTVDGRSQYTPDTDPSKTMLGEAQWEWLEAQLRQPAEVRLVVSSIQVVSLAHRFEKWANLPLERDRLFQLIEDTQAGGVMFLSGDRHRTELSRISEGTAYPFYDVTSSGLSEGDRSGTAEEDNSFRVSDALYRGTNFGFIRIDWDREDPLITLETRNVNGQLYFQQYTNLSELQP